jgi:IS5 family transposase
MRADGKTQPARACDGSHPQRKSRQAKPNGFGKMMNLQEAENQIVTDYEVYDRRRSDSDLLIAAVEARNANANRRSAGSATGRNGGPDARDASASSSGHTGSAAAAIRAMPE